MSVGFECFAILFGGYLYINLAVLGIIARKEVMSFTLRKYWGFGLGAAQCKAVRRVRSWVVKDHQNIVIAQYLCVSR